MLVVYTEPTEGQEAEYNRWYNNVHLDEVISVPGFIAAERFMIAAPPHVGPEPSHRYLALYEVEADSAEQALETLNGAIGGMNLSPSLDLEGASSVIYKAISPVHRRS
jgi:hypothetical protein